MGLCHNDGNGLGKAGTGATGRVISGFAGFCVEGAGGAWEAVCAVRGQ